MFTCSACACARAGTSRSHAHAGTSLRAASAWLRPQHRHISRTRDTRVHFGNLPCCQPLITCVAALSSWVATAMWDQQSAAAQCARPAYHARRSLARDRRLITRYITPCLAVSVCLRVCACMDACTCMSLFVLVHVSVPLTFCVCLFASMPPFCASLTLPGGAELDEGGEVDAWRCVEAGRAQGDAIAGRCSDLMRGRVRIQ